MNRTTLRLLLVLTSLLVLALTAVPSYGQSVIHACITKFRFYFRRSLYKIRHRLPAPCRTVRLMSLIFCEQGRIRYRLLE